MDTKVTALVAVRSRELRIALNALLESTVQIHAVYEASSVQASIDSLETYHPQLTLCDYSIFNEIDIQTNTQFVVLVDNRAEQNQVISQGVANVVITGTPVDHLIVMINLLLNPEEGSANNG